MSRRICRDCGQPFPAPSLTCPHCGRRDVLPVAVFLGCIVLTVAAIAYALWLSRI